MTGSHEETGLLPVSFAQERLWFLSRLEPASIAYHVPVTLELRGSVDVPSLEWSLTEIVRRHEALRTVFEEIEGTPRQRILAPHPVSLPVLDLRAGQGQASPAITRFITEESGKPFDLASGPLLRGALARLSQRRYLLLLTMHHIVFDAWSHRILNRELSALYRARVTGTEAGLPELAMQYADYARWQRESFQGARLEELRGYWRAQLAGVSPVLQLPAMRPRPVGQTYRGDLYRFELSQPLVERLRVLSRAHGVTLFMTMLAGFEIVLSRYSGRDDFLLGAPSANRGLPELEPMIGFFVNTLVLRADLRGDPTVAHLLDRARDTCLGAFEHQDMPFERLVDELAPARDLSYTPLVQVLFAFLADGDDGEAELVLPGARVRVVQREDASAKFDVTLRVSAGRERSSGAFAFNADLFHRDTIAQLADHLRVALTSMAAAPGAHISDIPIMDDEETHRVTVEWNRNGGTLDNDHCLHHLVERQAVLRPDSVAVEYEGRQLTYRELNERANQVAWWLRVAGVARDMVVGVCAERSAELIVATLGVLKAGAVYLPLDPEYPDERLRYMLTDAGVPAVVTQHRLAGRVASLATAAAILELDPGGCGPAALSASLENPGVSMSPDNGAYVIYTSGSTGRPKGTIVSHRAISNNLLWMQRDWPLTAADHVLHKTPFTFDVSVKELFWPLLAGARLVIARPDGHRDPAYLCELIIRAGITVTHFVPSMLRAFLAEPEVGSCRGLRLVMCGAEALSAGQRNEFLRRLPATRLLHLYGPTETAIAVTAWLCDEDSGDRVPLGRPMPNSRIYLLDERMSPVPVGVPGELYIAGAPLARGYLGQPALTADRFLPDPFGTGPGGRMYRTGDIALWRPDGLLQYIGRADEQVKIRGLRIEPGEVETLLRDHIGTADVAVVVREDGSAVGSRKLVAYVGTGTADVPSAGSLRGYLRDRVPGYLVPAAVVVLPGLPRLPSGKIDRQALPAPDWAAGEQRAAASNDTERALARVWSEVLGSGRVGVSDNFFEIGGDSLLCIQVVSHARRCGLVFSARDMFRHQTIADLAAVLKPAGDTGGVQDPVAGPVPLTPIQHRLFRQELPQLGRYTQARIVELAAQVRAEHVTMALGALTAHHDALRMRFTCSGGQWQAELRDDQPVPVRESDLAGVPDALARSRLSSVVEDLREEIDLQAGRVVTAAWCPSGEGRPPLLVLVAHHLVIDAVSWRVVLDDLQTALSALLREEPVALAAKTTPYSRWAAALAEYARSADLGAEVAYWISGIDPVPPLPLDPSIAPGGAQIRRHRVQLDSAQTSALLHRTPRALGVGVRDILMTGYLEAVAEWTGATCMRVDLDGHGRTEFSAGLDLSRSVGWFTAVYPVRLELGASPALRDRMHAVRHQLDAVPRGGIGYGVLRYLRGDVVSRTLAAAGQAQLSFNYFGQVSTAARPAADERPLVRLAPRTGEVNPLPAAHHEYPLSLSAAVADGVLTATWSYRCDLIATDTVAMLASRWLDCLRRAIALADREPRPGLDPAGPEPMVAR